MGFCDLAGKTALVTGSSRGIGRAIAIALARRGAKVLLHGVKESEKLRSAVAEAGNGAEFLTADFDNMEETAQLAATLRERKMLPDILVLNASVQSYTGLANFDDGEFRRMFRANVESPCLLLREVLPEMRRRNFGRVIFVASINAARPTPRLAVYGATKAALVNLARSAAKENAAFGITVNTILPGVIATDRNAAVLNDAGFAEKLTEEIPAHRFGTPEDCAGAVAFLASAEAAYITGAEIPIAGGMQL